MGRLWWTCKEAVWQEWASGNGHCCLQCSSGSMVTKCWSAGRTRQGALEAAGAAACDSCSQF